MNDYEKNAINNVQFDPNSNIHALAMAINYAKTKFFERMAGIDQANLADESYSYVTNLVNSVSDDITNNNNDNNDSSYINPDIKEAISREIEERWDSTLQSMQIGYTDELEGNSYKYNISNFDGYGDTESYNAMKAISDNNLPTEDKADYEDEEDNEDYSDLSTDIDELEEDEDSSDDFTDDEEE